MKSFPTVIQAELEKHASSVDEAMQEYLLELLKDEEAYEDIDTLTETVSSFLEDDVESASSIVNTLSVALQQQPTQAPCPTKTLLEAPQNFSPKENQTESSGISLPAFSQPNIAVAAKNKVKHRKERRKEARIKQKQAVATSIEDESSAWQQCQDEMVVWGGRGRGGRGAYAGRTNSVRSNVHLTFTMATPTAELLQDATMDIVKGRRYGMIGRNGCGKSTLLRRLANKSIPGIPHDMRILLVEQQQEMMLEGEVSALEALIQADVDRSFLLDKQDAIERALEDGTAMDMTKAAEQLGEVIEDLDAIDADTAPERALAILKGLGFSNDMTYGPVHHLSGGWRMRLAVAQALFCSNTDLVCLDECTNHLDLPGLDWLINYLKNSDKTLIVISHDRVFLDAVCTDIVVLEHKKLSYHVGNYSDYQRQQAEKAARESQILDAAERQRTKAQAFCQKQQAAANKKSADPNKQRQAKMIREKKMDRIGNYREDGKRYKLKSLKQMDMKSSRLAQKVQIEVEDPIIPLYFPNPTWPPSVKANDPIVRMEDVSFSYEGDEHAIFSKVTLSLSRGSKCAFVGKNGAGKSTLIKLISNEYDKQVRVGGEVWVQPNLRIGHVSQYTVEELEAYADQTVVEYAEGRLKAGKASGEVVAKAAGNVRQYLGAFGLGGKIALRKIGKLSGGERMRLCFATVMAEEPQLLLLDESTNHVDIETLESMSSALNAFEGSVLMVSHNQAFLSGFCKELWVLEDGRIQVNHSDTESFDELFSKYRNHSSAQSHSLSDRRQQKAALERKANKQRVGTQQQTALL